MNLQALGGRRIYVDANVFIYFLDATPHLREPASLLLHGARSHVFQGITGDAAVAEVMVGPYRMGNQLMIRNTQDFFQQPRFIDIVGHTSRTFQDAAMIRGTLDVPFIDALHLATAASAHCDGIVTHDSRMKAALGVEVIPLTSLGAD